MIVNTCIKIGMRKEDLYDKLLCQYSLALVGKEKEERTRQQKTTRFISIYIYKKGL